MKRLLVTTASIIALGLGGVGFANAHGNLQKQGLSGSSAPPAASATTQSQDLSTNQPQNRQAMTSHRATRMSRSEVIQAQRRLHADGLYRGRIDGKFGPGTRAALRHFQQQNHLPQTARFDNRTMSSLMGAGMGQGSSRALTTHHRTMGSNRLQQNANQPGGQTNTMGQGSSTEPNATQMTPPTQQTPTNGGATNETPNTGTGTQNNQK